MPSKTLSFLNLKKSPQNVQVGFEKRWVQADPSYTMLTVSLMKQKTLPPLIIYQEARGPLKRTPKN